MTDKDIKDYCKNCDVEPPAMRLKCPECEHNSDKQIFVKDINVSRKEQIMIDGVDVSKCEFILDSIGIICNLKNGRTDKCNCSDYPNCDFKQLARKTQECEKLQEQISKIKEYVRHNMFDVDCDNWFDRFIYTFEDWKKSILENENKYKQECEELKEENEELNKRNNFLLQRLEVDDTETSLVFKLRKELENSKNEFYFAIKSELKYKQALDEIEKKCCAVLNGDEKMLYAYRIKEIINKTKEQ